MGSEPVAWGGWLIHCGKTPVDSRPSLVGEIVPLALVSRGFTTVVKRFFEGNGILSALKTDPVSSALESSAFKPRKPTSP